MSAHLTLTSGNPALGADTFSQVAPGFGTDAMTIRGTVNKTAISLALLLITAMYL